MACNKKAGFGNATKNNLVNKGLNITIRIGLIIIITNTLTPLSCILGREFGMRLIKSTLGRETRGGGLKAGGEGKTQGCQGGQRDSLRATWD